MVTHNICQLLISVCECYRLCGSVTDCMTVISDSVSLCDCECVCYKYDRISECMHACLCLWQVCLWPSDRLCVLPIGVWLTIIHSVYLWRCEWLMKLWFMSIMTWWQLCHDKLYVILNMRQTLSQLLNCHFTL